MSFALTKLGDEYYRAGETAHVAALQSAFDPKLGADTFAKARDELKRGERTDDDTRELAASYA